MAAGLQTMNKWFRRSEGFHDLQRGRLKEDAEAGAGILSCRIIKICTYNFKKYKKELNTY